MGLGDRRSLDAGRDVDEGTCGRVYPVPVDLEHSMASHHEEQLLI